MVIRSRGPRRGVLLGAGLLGAGLSALPALAQDEGGLRMVFGLEQRFEAGRNLGLEVPDEGDSVSAETRLSFGLSDRTALSVLEFGASAALVIENTPDSVLPKPWKSSSEKFSVSSQRVFDAKLL